MLAKGSTTVHSCEHNSGPYTSTAPEALGQEQNVHNWMSGQEGGRCPEASNEVGRWLLSSWRVMNNLDRGIKQA